MKNAFDLRPEQWVLCGALVILGVVALLKAFTLPDIDPVTTGGGGSNPDEYDTAKIESISERWNTPPQINETDHKVYVSRLIVYIPSSQRIMPLSDDNEIKEMKVGWLKKYNLSLEDPNIAISDPDQDGFSNKEEFDGQTDPKNIESHPDLLKKLCVKDYEFIAFNLEFKGYTPDPAEGGYSYLINLLDVQRNRTRTVKEGDELNGYIIGAFELKEEERLNPRTQIVETIDVSTLEIINPTLSKSIFLTKNVPAKSDESKVEFDLKVPHVNIDKARVRIGETFNIQDRSFQVLEASENEALIRNTETNDRHVIQRCQ